MLRKVLFALPLAALISTGCGDSDNEDMGMNNPDMGVDPVDMGQDPVDMGQNPVDMGMDPPDMGVQPPPPAPTINPANQIDRNGRPAANTALNNTFNPDSMAAGVAKDAYNMAGPGDWANFTDEIIANLAIYDSLDTVCGNQAFADPMAMDATRYATLGGALTNDFLLVNSTAGTCTQYLGLELGLMNECGGRAPTYDVIDVTYSALAIGAGAGVSDGVDANDVALSDADFPFLADPN